MFVNSSQTRESNWVPWDPLSKQHGKVQCRFHNAMLRNNALKHIKTNRAISQSGWLFGQKEVDPSPIEVWIHQRPVDENKSYGRIQQNKHFNTSLTFKSAASPSILSKFQCQIWFKMHGPKSNRTLISLWGNPGNPWSAARSPIQAPTSRLLSKRSWATKMSGNEIYSLRPWRLCHTSWENCWHFKPLHDDLHYAPIIQKLFLQ